MEKRLGLMRDMIKLEEQQTVSAKAAQAAGGTRWGSATTAKPIRKGYVDHVSKDKARGGAANSGVLGSQAAKLDTSEL